MDSKGVQGGWTRVGLLNTYVMNECMILKSFVNYSYPGIVNVTWYMRLFYMSIHMFKHTSFYIWIISKIEIILSFLVYIEPLRV